MSKIICDVCGTSYPETATQCPICGCVRSGDPVTVAGDTNEADIRPASSYTYVKGGRFSKTNVKKRNAGKPVYSAEPAQRAEENVSADKKTEKGFIIAVAVLLLAIAAVVIYIACSFLRVGNSDAPDGTPGADIQTQQTTQATQSTQPTETTLADIPCESLTVSDTVIEFDKAGAILLLNVTALPENQTDKIQFVSDNIDVATVDGKGKVTAVGAGQTVITITCGEQSVECRVVCNIQEETTAPTEPEVTYPVEEFKLNSEDFTIWIHEGSYTLYDGDIPVDMIDWISEDETIALFVDGVVTPINSGVVTVYAIYQDITLECIVRVP